MSQYRYIHSVWPASIGDGSTLSLDFTTGVLDPRFTFTRSTTGTYINSSGYVTSASINTARFDYDPTTLTPRGLLIEGSANSLTRSSQDLTNATYWTLQTAYASTSAAGGTAPDGTNSGNLFTEPSSSLQRSIYQSYSSAAGTYTFSVWLKAGSGSTRYMRLVVSSGASDFGYVTINMSTGAVQQSAVVSGTATNASATVSGNYSATGWRRYSLTVTLAASVNFVFLIPTDLASIDTPTSNYGRIQYLGDGSSFLIWGAQLEAGSGASSYIPTGASQGNRGQDLVSITSTDFSSWWLSSNPLSMWFDMEATGRAFTNGVFRVADASGSAYGYQAYWFGTSFPIQLRATISGPVNSDISLGTVAANTRTKFAYTINSAAVKRFKDGSLVNTVSAPVLPPDPMTRFYFGGNPAFGGASGDFYLRGFKYWPIVLSDSQIISLTT